MKYLITGGAGFIGSHLTEALVKRGDFVIVVDNLSTGSNEFSSSVEFIKGSIFDESLMDKLVSKVDHVLHLAAAVGVFNIVKSWNGESSVALSSGFDLAILATPHDYLNLSLLGDVPVLNTRGSK